MKSLEGPEVGQLVPVDEIDMSQYPASVTWIPRWLVDCGKGCEVGITIDDHCFVVLAKSSSGQWGPATHIPWQAVDKLGKLFNGGLTP